MKNILNNISVQAYSFDTNFYLTPAIMLSREKFTIGRKFNSYSIIITWLGFEAAITYTN
jgi:hypothetical protein